MAWTEGTDGSLAHAGTDRDVWLFDDPMPANSSFKLQLGNPAHNVKAVLFSSHDGGSCWEAGVEGADLVIRRVDFGTEQPFAVWISHGQVAGIPFLAEFRVQDSLIRILLNGQEVAALEYDTIAQYSFFRRFGVVSKINGASVLRAELCELAPAVETAQRVLVAVGGGSVYKSAAGGNLFEVERSVFRERGPVCLIEHQSGIYGVDGQRGRIINPVTDSVTLWIADDGTLPGKTTDGSTTLGLIISHAGRIWGVPADDNRNLYASGIGLTGAKRWDTAATYAGRAFTTPLARASQSAQVIRALAIGSNNHLLAGGAACIWRMMGDPVRGQVLFEPLSATIGVSGRGALVLADEGFVLFHSPAGLYMTPAGGSPVPLSAGVLTEGIDIDPDELDSYTVSVVRDTRRKLVHVFLTKEADSLHFVYDEREGGYAGGKPALYPVQYPDRIGPTCAVYWGGEVLLGGRDGYIYVLDDAATDDDGDEIESWVTLSQTHKNRIEEDTILQRLFPMMANGSVPVTVRAWKGVTAEDAYDPAQRVLGWQREGVRPRAAAITQPCRGGCILVEIHSESGRWSVEAFSAQTSSAQLSSRHGWQASVAAGALCRATSGSGSPASGGGASIASGPGFGQSYGNVSGPPAGGHSKPASGGSKLAGSWYAYANAPPVGGVGAE